MRKMFGNIINPANIKEGSIRSVFALAKEGYNTIYILAGSDRLKTATDCERDSGTDIKKLKTCWEDSFFKSVIPSLEKMGVDVTKVLRTKGKDTFGCSPFVSSIGRKLGRKYKLKTDKETNTIWVGRES